MAPPKQKKVQLAVDVGPDNNVSDVEQMEIGGDSRASHLRFSAEVHNGQEVHKRKRFDNPSYRLPYRDETQGFRVQVRHAGPTLKKMEPGQNMHERLACKAREHEARVRKTGARAHGAAGA